jgi:hypothetical protein
MVKLTAENLSSKIGKVCDFHPQSAIKLNSYAII